jgi:hypothetical protein
MSLYNLQSVTDRRLEELRNHAAATPSYIDEIDAEFNRRKFIIDEYRVTIENMD